jgi:hypothetical protein
MYAGATIAGTCIRIANPARALSGRKKNNPIKPPISVTTPQTVKPLL